MTLHIVVDGMFGSCGKGHLAAQLAAREDEPIVIRTGGPNAGHTVLDKDKNTYKLRCLPTAAISNPEALLCLAAGSVIDPQVLSEEIKLVGGFTNPGFQVVIDPAATILEPYHIKAEHDPHPDGLGQILSGWSTQKGIGAARMDRLARRGKIARDWDWSQFGPTVVLGDVGDLARRRLKLNDAAHIASVIIETAQGYGLGLHTDYYPKTTSADCRAIDALADVGVSPWTRGSTPTVWIAFRPYPIRVAGDSGPLHGETTWEALGLEPERTTVTNKVRRVGTWDARLARKAVVANGGPSAYVRAVLMMADQVLPEIRNTTSDSALDSRLRYPKNPASDVRDRFEEWVDRVGQTGAPLRALGTGPDSMVFL